jgi:hypothetical protein
LFACLLRFFFLLLSIILHFPTLFLITAIRMFVLTFASFL